MKYYKINKKIIVMKNKSNKLTENLKNKKCKIKIIRKKETHNMINNKIINYLI